MFNELVKGFVKGRDGTFNEMKREHAKPNNNTTKHINNVAFDLYKIITYNG